MYTTITFEKQAGIGIVALNRPDVLNAMDMVMREELKDVFAAITKDDEVRVIVIKGNGRAFCAGGDLSTMGEVPVGAGIKRMHNVHLLYKAIQTLGKPVIAMIQGAATGSGLSMACACDFRIAADNSKFAASFINVGLVPDCGIMYALPRIVGLSKAKEMFMLATMVKAAQALEIGLVDKVVPAEELEQEVMALASELASKSSIALGLLKEITNKAFELSLPDLMQYEAFAQDVCFSSEAHRSAVKKFLEARKK